MSMVINEDALLVATFAETFASIALIYVVVAYKTVVQKVLNTALLVKRVVKL